MKSQGQLDIPWLLLMQKKHGLNYQQSFKDNNIAQLKILYQGGGATKGASYYCFERAKSEITN